MITELDAKMPLRWLLTILLLAISAAALTVGAAYMLMPGQEWVAPATMAALATLALLVSRMDAPEMTTTDDELTEFGATFQNGPQDVLLIACGAIAREVLAVTKSAQLDHITLRCLPAKLHNEPDKITPEVERLLRETSGQYSQTYVLYADCGTGGQLFDLCNKHGVEMLKGPHCYSFFEGNNAFEKRTEEDFMSFYLTDFLVRQFDAFIVKPLGLDKHPELRDMYFGNYKKLVYQVQVPDPKLDALAQGYADFLGLEYQRIETGYGDLAVELNSWLGPKS